VLSNIDEISRLVANLTFCDSTTSGPKLCEYTAIISSGTRGNSRYIQITIRLTTAVSSERTITCFVHISWRFCTSKGEKISRVCVHVVIDSRQRRTRQSVSRCHRQLSSLPYRVRCELWLLLAEARHPRAISRSVFVRILTHGPNAGRVRNRVGRRPCAMCAMCVCVCVRRPVFVGHLIIAVYVCIVIVVLRVRTVRM